MKAPEKLLRDGNHCSSPKRGRKISRVSPRSELKYFCRVAMARRYSDAMTAVVDLSGRLLRRGQRPDDVAHDIALLADHGGFGRVVAIVVNDLATRGAA
ncbi:hypothetical protein [Burkholderia sp. WTPI3]|uniref:hypothetical protein n=1 Tax=Burkholderia sp. WTPI3 TaxID=2822167 RepID=UPI001F437B47|nr:hypothetical protein [Burkholderia sp. WTPI3]